MKKESAAVLAKAMAVVAFRDGPLEDLHAGKACPTCAGKDGVSHISQAQMKRLMQYAVNWLYTMMMMQRQDPGKFLALVRYGAEIASEWDEPEDVGPGE